LFLASLGTCAGIYVLGFCRQRGLPAEGIRLVQRMGFNPASGKLDRVDLDIQVPAAFPEKYHEALIRAASQCAVKKLLEQPPAIEVKTSVQG
jgi:ribosomal protein S12 methylthiotransferase accessory factor